MLTWSRMRKWHHPRSEVADYGKRWPFVFLVNDWDVWHESKKALRLQVIRWLERYGGAYDFSVLQGGGGLVGFTDLKAAIHFKLRWSGQGRVISVPEPKKAPVQDWSPHPVRSTFEALGPSEAPQRHPAQTGRKARSMMGNNAAG
ncbi:hypothetical protein IC232_15755 [Microvirga sp. BT688]|uniref:hypothetical protein n=1 Tax=Microvirga sp. TaxID=1873136 RepID=UPI001686326D|nr:hypothetical protein [Microvirga sp.]MBD2748152.1 hypothetical protein [Microvirga sp.]